MKTQQNIPKSSWTKVVVTKWLNMKSKSEEFHSDHIIDVMGGRGERRRKSCSDDGSCAVVPEELSESWFMERNGGIEEPILEKETSTVTDHQKLRMLVGTWNVGGKSPHEELNLGDWLNSAAPADIYVLGFQEIVPLNAGNVLGPEDSGPAAKWLSLIRKALNNDTNSPDFSFNYNNSSKSERKSSSSSLDDLHQQQSSTKPREDWERLLSLNDNVSPSPNCMSNRYNSTSSPGKSRYYLAASKQMVGLFFKIIWLGDLNYRLASGCEDTIEQRAGRIFNGWKEGRIYFAPTYKYLYNSDYYVAHTFTSKEKRRTPAWCDRILWKGEGLNQICYVRGESKFSDHRPVYSLFSVDTNLTLKYHSKKEHFTTL
ncbi:unnamed protein product [Withania somnifera]